MDKNYRIFWLYLQLAGWRNHPGYNRPGGPAAPSLEECLEQALAAERYFTCRLSQQQSSQEEQPSQEALYPQEPESLET